MFLSLFRLGFADAPLSDDSDTEASPLRCDSGMSSCDSQISDDEDLLNASFNVTFYSVRSYLDEMETSSDLSDSQLKGKESNTSEFVSDQIILTEPEVDANFKIDAHDIREGSMKSLTLEIGNTSVIVEELHLENCIDGNVSYFKSLEKQLFGEEELFQFDTPTSRRLALIVKKAVEKELEAARSINNSPHIHTSPGK